ncbi:MAG: hypothetical protein ACKVG0_00285, partial [Alphaproteobacteria bacterium]
MTDFALPTALQRGIENLAADYSGRRLASCAEKISDNYIAHKPSRSVHRPAQASINRDRTPQAPRGQHSLRLA